MIRKATNTAVILALLLASHPTATEDSDASLYEGQSGDIFGRNKEDIARGFFKRTIDTYAYHCLADKSPTEAEFEALFDNIEGVCEAVMATPTCRKKTEDYPQGIEEYALLQCNDLEGNLESTPESLWSCAAGFASGGWDIAKFIGQIMWLAARLMWSPFETSSEYYESAMAYLGPEWRRAEARVPNYRFRGPLVAAHVAGGIGRAIWKSLNDFFAREYREFGCLNQQARIALACQVTTVIFGVKPAMQGFTALLRAGTAKAGSAVANAIRAAAAPYLARIKGSPLGRLAGGAVQTGRSVRGGIAEGGRRARTGFNRARNLARGAREGYREANANIRNRARNLARGAREGYREANANIRNRARSLRQRSLERAGEGVQAIRDSPGNAARAIGDRAQRAASNAGRLGRAMVGARPTAEALARAQAGTGVSVNILGRGTHNARVVRKVGDDVVEVDFITSGGTVGTELVNINYLGRPVANLPIPLPRTPTTPIVKAPVRNPVQESLPIPRTNVRAGRTARLRERIGAGLTRESRRAWRRSRGTMRDARPGQEVSFYHRELGVVNGRVTKHLDGGRAEISILTVSTSSDAVNTTTLLVRRARLGEPVQGLIPAPEPILGLRQTIRGAGLDPSGRPYPSAQQVPLPLSTPIPTKALPTTATLPMGAILADIRQAVHASGLVDIARGTGSAVRNAGNSAGRVVTETRSRIRESAEAIASAPGRAAVATGRAASSALNKTSPAIYASRSVVDRVQSQAESLPRAAENAPAQEEPPTIADRPRERAILPSGQSLPFKTASSPTVVQSVSVDGLRREEPPTREGLSVASGLWARAGGNLRALPLFNDKPFKARYERTSEWPYFYRDGYPMTGRSPQSTATPDAQAASKASDGGWFARLKRLFGFKEGSEKPFTAKEGDRVSFRNWENFGGLSNARVTRDEGQYARLTFTEARRNTNREIIVAKSDIYRPLGASLDHVKPGERVSIASGFWHRRDGTVTEIKDDKIRVGFLSPKDTIHYEWVPTEQLEGPTTTGEIR